MRGRGRTSIIGLVKGLAVGIPVERIKTAEVLLSFFRLLDSCSHKVHVDRM